MNCFVKTGVVYMWCFCLYIVWREFVFGAIAGAFGEGALHPIDTIKTRIQSQAIFTGSKVAIIYIRRLVYCFIIYIHMKIRKIIQLYESLIVYSM